MPRKHPIRVFYANQPIESKQVSFMPDDQVRDLARAGLGQYINHGMDFRLEERTRKRKFLDFFDESHFVRGDTIHGTVLADKYETIGAEKFPKECQGGLTRDEHSPNAKLWQPRKAFKLESI